MECAQQVRHKGSDWLQELKATPLAPFGVLSKDPQKRPELFECFVTVQLPAPNMSLSEIILHLDGSNRTVTALLEVRSSGCDIPKGFIKGLHFSGEMKSGITPVSLVSQPRRLELP